MSPRPHTAQPERSAAKSKASPPTLRLRRSRGAVYPERSSTSALRAYAQNERKRRAQSERESNQGCTRVKTALTLRQDPFSEERLQELGLNERQRQAVAYVREKGRITNQEYRQLTGVSNKTAYLDLNGLVDKQVLAVQGTKSNHGRFVHLLTYSGTFSRSS